MHGAQKLNVHIQNVLDLLPTVRGYVWDTSSYEAVAEWEASIIEAVERTYGKDSRELRELSAAIADESWKSTNRPDAVAPEVFVNRDFQARLDNIETMLKRYLETVSTAQKQIRKKPSKTRAKAATAAKRKKRSGIKKKAAKRKTAKKKASKRKRKTKTKTKKRTS